MPKGVQQATPVCGGASPWGLGQPKQGSGGTVLYADCSKVQKVTTRMVTCAGVQQSAVPQWHQAGAGTSHQLLETAQVGHFLHCELGLQVIAGHLLHMQCQKAPAE